MFVYVYTYIYTHMYMCIFNIYSKFWNLENQSFSLRRAHTHTTFQDFSDSLILVTSLFLTML